MTMTQLALHRTTSSFLKTIANPSLSSLPMAFYTTASSESHLPPRLPRTQSLAGSVPYHTSYLFLHTQDPPESWPATFNFPLYLQLKEKLAKHNALVNVCWSESQATTTNSSTTEVYGGTVWIKRDDDQGICKGTSLPAITSDTISIFDQPLSQLVDDVDLNSSISRPAESRIAEKVSAGPYFYICCHGLRDCRCGIRGGDLAHALTDELAKRNMLLDERGQPRLGRVGHVGGHKNAPNLIIFPHGDWYGNLDATDLPYLVNHYVQSSVQPDASSLSLYNAPNKLQWRGRIGMTKQEQLEYFLNFVNNQT